MQSVHDKSSEELELPLEMVSELLLRILLLFRLLLLLGLRRLVWLAVSSTCSCMRILDIARIWIELKKLPKDIEE